ncbi:MAG TPA: hypothetical protein VGB62_10790 [Allosphingosinicella sp.]|jgi:hypothetical protein
MNAKALDNLINKAGSVPVTGVTFTSADQAADFKFEPSEDLSGLLTSMIAARGVSGTIDALGSDATAFKLVWDHLDDNYTYYNTNVNDAFIDLGIAYADYLKAGGERLLDVAKFAPDGSDADLLPERSQTLHDNILGNFDERSIDDKFGAGADEIFDRIEDAGFGAFLGELGNYADGRPIYNGNDTSNPLPTILFDQAFFG